MTVELPNFTKNIYIERTKNIVKSEIRHTRSNGSNVGKLINSSKEYNRIYLNNIHFFNISPSSSIIILLSYLKYNLSNSLTKLPLFHCILDKLKREVT